MPTHATIAGGKGALGQIAAILGIAVAIFVLLPYIADEARFTKG